jgi:hypothetical protein
MQGKYIALELHLKAIPKDHNTVVITFDELNKILGSPLPESAYSHRPWWGNQKDTANRPQAKAWISAGFKVDTVDQSKFHGYVNFIRSK